MISTSIIRIDPNDCGTAVRFHPLLFRPPVSTVRQDVTGQLFASLTQSVRPQILSEESNSFGSVAVFRRFQIQGCQVFDSTALAGQRASGESPTWAVDPPEPGKVAIEALDKNVPPIQIIVEEPCLVEAPNHLSELARECGAHRPDLSALKLRKLGDEIQQRDRLRYGASQDERMAKAPQPVPAFATRDALGAGDT
jgi:hypothetical protein